MTINSGETYCASAEMVTAGETSAEAPRLLSGSSENSSNQNSSYVFSNLPGGNSWTPGSTCVTATGPHTDLRVQIYPDYNGPTIAFDAVDAHPDLVENGGFNAGTADWEVGSGTNFAVYVNGQVTGTNAYEGNSFGATNAPSEGASVHEDIPMTINSGETYCASAEMVTAGEASGGGASLAIWLIGGSSNEGSSYVFSNLPGGNSWTPGSTCVTATEPHTDLRIQIYPDYNGPTIAFDAVDTQAKGFGPAYSASLQDAPSTQQYLLHGSDGTTWEAMDTDLLADTFSPTTTGTAVLSANADLWTFNAGFNQDLGICLVPGSNAPATCPTGDLLAWKESGGFAGTFSPNAAYVQAAAPVTSGTTYTAFVVWKANKAMPAGDTIAAGAGSSPTFSPTRLTVALPDSSNVESSASSTEQYLLHGSDGSTWNYVDPSTLKLTLSPASAVDTVLSANADLWTFNAGYNQDIGICVAAGASLPAGNCPSSDVVIWKELGGFAGTFSPNAAFAQTVVPMSAGTYSVALVWKANKTMPSGDTIAIGAGSSPTFSPTRLTALQYPTGGSAAIASSTEQYILDGGSDGVTWQPIDATHLSLTVPQATGCQAEIGGNADLWTFNAGFNQDIGIQVTPAGGSPYVAAWKESGGFAGTFSPNAAFVQAVIPLSDATSYSITLVWKTNKPMPSSDHIAVAAGSTGAFSPTTLTLTEHC